MEQEIGHQHKYKLRFAGLKDYKILMPVVTPINQASYKS